MPAKAALRNRALRQRPTLCRPRLRRLRKAPHVIDMGYDVGLGIQDLAEVYRAVERLGVCFDTAAHIGQFCPPRQLYQYSHHAVQYTLVYKC